MPTMEVWSPSAPVRSVEEIRVYKLFRHLFGVLLVLCASPLAGPAGLEAQLPGTVTGEVRSSTTGAPIHGAVVSVRGARTATDASGRFRVTGVAPGSFEVEAGRIGFATVTRTIELPAGSTVSVNLVLAEAATVGDPIVVTATRREERLRDLPVSVGIVTGEQLREMRPSHVAQPLNRVAGVHIVEFEGDGTHNSIRQPLCCKPTLLIMEDGIPFTSPAFYSTSMIGWVNYAQAGGLEVLKGPGTAVYGSDAVSGVINFLSAPPPVGPAASLSLEGGGAGYRRAMASAGTSAGSHAVSVDAMGYRTDGRRGNPQEKAAATLRWTAGELAGGSLRTIVTFNHRDGTGSDDQTPEQYRTRSSFNPYPLAANTARIVRASSTYERSWAGTSLRVTPFARYMDWNQVPTWQLSYNPVVWEVEGTSLGLQAQVTRDLNTLGARLTAGVDLDRSPTMRREPTITPVARTDDEGRTIWADWSLTSAEPQYHYDADFAGVAGYAQLEVAPATGVRVTLGGRYDHASYDYRNRLSVVTEGSRRRPADATRDYSRFTPKLGLTWEVSPSTVLFGSYREGFRVPTEAQLFKQGSSLNTVDLQPIDVRSFEAGSRFSVSDRMRVELSAYSLRLMNDILSYRSPQGVAAATNNGGTLSRGVEVSLTAGLAPGLTLEGAYTLSKHTFERWRLEDEVDFSGAEMDAAPRHMMSAYLTWSPQALRGGTFSAEWTGMSGYWVDRGTNQKWEDGYGVLHLRGSVGVHERLELFGRLMNVTDRLYAGQVFDGFGTIDRLYNPGEQRTMYLGLRGRL